MAVKQKIRRELEARLETIRRRVEKIRTDLERKSQPLALDWEEAAVTRQNDEVLDGLEREGEEQIAALLEALRRLDAGTYGVCARCHGRIAEERLEALPQAIHCIACAS
jgi:RNA polymerase-binding transcription factor DksA